MESFTKQYYIEDYMCDRQYHMLPSYLLKLTQSISIQHCESASVYSRLVELGQRFLLTKQHCTIARPILARETLTVTTSPTTASMGIFPRVTKFVDSNGDTVATVDARWFLFDIVNRKPLRAMDSSIEYNCIDVGKLPPINMPRIDAPLLHTRQVQYTHIDSNYHINNAVYLDYLSDILGDKFISQFAISYRKEVTTDNIQLHGCYTDNNNYYLAGYCDDTKSFEIVATLDN